MGFRRIASVVTRSGGHNSPAATAAGAGKGKARVREHLPDDAAPRIFFSVLLDSGASYPVLTRGDLLACGIDPAAYSASSAVSIEAFDARVVRSLYEMEAGVFAADSSGLANPSVWPAEPSLLGGLTPVVMSEAPPGPATRLSGMLPWLACYTASAPTRSSLYLGSDRADVLGAQRMPGQQRYSVARELATAHPEGLWRRLAGDGNPVRIVFEHKTLNGNDVVDRDIGGDAGSSVVTYKRKGLVRVWEIEPRRQAQQRRPKEPNVKTRAAAKKAQMESEDAEMPDACTLPKPGGVAHA
jgi:hypothetical protein